MYCESGFQGVFTVRGGLADGGCEVYKLCFGEEKIRDDKSVPGKKGWPPVVQKGTQAKMARGEMVRFAAQQDIRDWRELRGFNRLGYEFREEYSSESQLVFVKKKD